MAPLNPQVLTGGRGVRIRTQSQRKIVPAAIFEWSGQFPFPATNNADLLTYIGLDLGENSSHLWQGSISAGDVLDEGTLAAAIFDLDAGSVTETTDPDFRQGVGNVIELDPSSDVMVTASDTGQRIPSAKDGTKSFIVGGIVRMDDIAGGDVPRNILSQITFTGNGWDVTFFNTSRKVRFRISQNGFAQQDVAQAVVPFVVGEPFAFLCNLDVAAGLVKCVTSEDGSYAQTAWTDIGAFDSASQSVRVGDSDTAGIGGFVGIEAQLFSFEYSAALDAGLSQETMTRFLEFCDGFQTV